MASKTIKDYYAILGVPPNATPEQIRAAFRHMARVNHPDINTSPDAAERFKEVNEAYEILANPDKRKAYDYFTAMSGGTEAAVTPPPPPTPTGVPVPPYVAPTGAA